MGKYTDIARSLPPDAAETLPPVQERRDAEARATRPPVPVHIPADTPETDAVTRQRWGRTPRGRVAIDTALQPLPDGLAGLLERHMKAQPAEVHHWIEDHAARYARRGPGLTFPACLAVARLDLLLWQWEAVLAPPDRTTRFARIQEAVHKLREIEALFYHHHETEEAAEEEARQEIEQP
jgi:hypothetical protein